MPKKPSRRQFFEDSFKSIMEPIAEFLADHIEDTTDTSPTSPTLLRPPGAIVEKEFLDTCFRCGNCVEACPADAIRLFPSDDELLNNTPVVDPDLAACVICEDLSCMKACPSGALRLVDSPSQIRMGTARLYETLCVRSQGDDCTKCIDLCPLGETAIRLDQQGVVEVLSPGCVGCGVCQYQCPTQPKAIAVIPSR